MKYLEIAGSDISEIARYPEKFPPELVAVALTRIKKIKSEMTDYITLLEHNIINRMTEDGATKLTYRDNDRDGLITLKSGKIECKARNADEVYKSAGFEPLEIGTYEFKPSWTKAKEARKFGGAKQNIIDAMFQEGRKSLAIE